jgi:hypothetical protein
MSKPPGSFAGSYPNPSNLQRRKQMGYKKRTQSNINKNMPVKQELDIFSLLLQSGDSKTKRTFLAYLHLKLSAFKSYILFLWKQFLN